jgi:Raf kinase inhibitor-like YbhB/YbcL family protein
MLTLSTPIFKPDGPIPPKYTCEGADVSPRLSWQNLPAATKSLVLIMDDPDAPRGTFDHWIAYDIPPSMTELAENFPPGGEIQGIKQGKNDMGMMGYGGPCPPPGHGVHHYRFKLYAVDLPTLGLAPGAAKKEIEAKMRGHILENAEMVGVYKR